MISSIFVSVASYRDDQCGMTIKQIFQKAKFPFRVFVGICEQNESNHQEERCLSTKDEKEMEPYFSQIRRISIPHDQAKGPTFARYLCSRLYRGETFFLQIDSHSLFVKDWDEKLITMWMTLHHTFHIPKPILSYYCDTYERYEEEDTSTTITTMTQIGKDAMNMFYFLGAEYLPKTGYPRLSPFISAQMMFLKGEAIREVPFDPYLPDLFFGEEILWSVRFFTHGYMVFTPSEHIIYHAYIREKKPKYWTDLPIDLQFSLDKVRYLLGWISYPPQSFQYWKTKNPPFPDEWYQTMDQSCLWDQPFGHGKERTVAQYWKWIGLQSFDFPSSESIRIPTSILEEHVPTFYTRKTLSSSSPNSILWNSSSPSASFSLPSSSYSSNSSYHHNDSNNKNLVSWKRCLSIVFFFFCVCLGILGFVFCILLVLYLCGYIHF